MADCSKTVEFFKERDRMCDSFECEDCPIYRDNNGKREHCEEFCSRYTDEAVQILQKWSDEHPMQKPKTYADDFFEKFPKAAKNGRSGYPSYPSGACKRKIYDGTMCDDYSHCEICWNEPYEEDTTNG